SSQPRRRPYWATGPHDDGTADRGCRQDGLGADGAGTNPCVGEWATDPHRRWLASVAEEASGDADGVPAQLLGEYLPLLAEAALTGRRPRRHELEAVARRGRQAAEQGISAGGVVQLYLAAARRIWQGSPAVAYPRDREAVRTAAAAVLQVVDDAVAT